jgi:hypothetical protein
LSSNYGNKNTSMKYLNIPQSIPLTRKIAPILAVAALLLSSLLAQAHPYASGVTNDNGTIRFILNEGGATVYVVFEDGTTNNSFGVLPRGGTNFLLGAHTSYSIYVVKTGDGNPAQISNDSDQWAIYANPRGVSVNRNPKTSFFGRIYAGSVGNGGFAYGTPGYKPQGLFYFNADFSAGALGTNQTPASGFFGGSGPWRIRVCPDNDLLVGDFSGNGSLYKFSPDLLSHITIFNSTQPAGIHGDGEGTAFITGTLEDGNMTLYVPDSGMGIPNTVAALGPTGTTPWGSSYATAFGNFNNLYRYDIGAGPIPAGGWPNPPNYAYNMGLPTIAELRTEADIGKDGKLIAGFGRGNLSNPDIQILSPDGSTYLWDSWQNTGGSSDQWNGTATAQGGVGTQGIRVSPDGRFLASVDFKNGIMLALLTNGIPDEGSIFTIPNTPYGVNTSATGPSGIDWDAADNLYIISRGQLLLRTFSLGISTTCVTSNDFSGTNGSFQMVLPSVQASGSPTVSLASQNYGTPIPGVFRITLNTTTLSTPVTVNYTRGGTAVYTNHYTINTNESPNGVTINPNNVVFPAGTMPGGGNWTVDVKITPTALPVSTNTLTVIMTVVGGPTYQAVAPIKGTIAIQNTGPQLLLLTAAGSGTNMYRGTANDYAKFIITRLGDTNGPNNTLGNVTPKAFTVTNVSYFGTAVFPTDYGARAQRLDPAGNGAIQAPVNGPTAIVFNPGDTTVTCVVGNPVAHADLNNPQADVTIVANLTNQVSGAGSTNGLQSSEGYPYNVGLAQVTLTELDNRVGPEFVLYSNPLTNANDTSWTLTFDSAAFGAQQQLPLVIPNYVNDTTYGTNDFLAHFGFDPSLDSVGPSIQMLNSNWTGVLKVKVNQTAGATESVNLYPQGQNFQGNYALRFNMYLSMYDFALNNPSLLAPAREFAIFGVNHQGTNCIWRPDAPLTGVNAPTNSDGVWCAVDASSGSITPADYESYVPGPVPNNANGTTPLPSKVSTPASGVNGIFKHPPFDAANVTTPTIAAPGGGQAIDQWVDVSLEITKQTNMSLYINRSLILVWPLTNGLGLASSYTNGTIMLGYQDPNPNTSDGRAFAYFSNVRVVELSPYITVQPGLTNSGSRNLIVPQFSSLTLTTSVSFATAPITNIWFEGTGAGNNPATGVPTALIQSNSVNASSMTDSLTRTFNNITDATNYMSVFSDAAGSVTSTVVSVEVVFGPTNKAYTAWGTNTMVTVAAGPFAPTAQQWYFNTASNFATATKLANNTHYAGVTTGTLTMTNLTSSDAGYYWTAVTNSGGFVIPQAATLTVATPPYSFGTITSAGANVSMGFTSSNPFDTSSAFILQSAGLVTGPYTNNPAAITGTNPNFLVNVVKTGDQMFYRLKHK